MEDGYFWHTRDVLSVNDACFIRIQWRHYLSGGLKAQKRVNPRGNCSAHERPRVNLGYPVAGSAISVENLSQVPFNRPPPRRVIGADSGRSVSGRRARFRGRREVVPITVIRAIGVRYSRLNDQNAT